MHNMKKTILLLIFLIISFSASAQWLTTPTTPQRNNITGNIRWLYGTGHVFDPTPALAQKDTLGSLMNYHFNGFTTVNSDPWDEAIAGLVQESDSTLVASYVVDSMIVRAPSYGSSTAVQGLRYNLNTHKWSAPFVIYSNQPDHYSLFSSGGVGVTTNKRQFVFFRRSDGVTGVPIDVGYIYSDDRWATHSTYAAISGTSVTSTYGKMTKGTGGYFKTLYGVNKCELLISTDSTTWSYYSTPYSYGSDQADGALNEPFIKTIGTDSILLVTRTANGRYWQYLSVDNGATFTFINKLPQPTFPLTSAISPEIIYDKKKKKILVLVADRILQNNTRAFNKDKMVLYAEGKDLNAKIINEIQRPAVNGRPLGGYSSTVQLTDSTFFGVTSEIKSQDTTLATTVSATIQNLYSYTIKYSDNNLYQNNIPGGGQIPYFNAKNGNWETISYPNQAFYFDPVTNTISPIQDARFLLNGKVTTVDFLEYNRNKSAFSGGRSTDLTQYNDSNIGNYSFSWGNQSKAKGNKSFAFGSNVTATGVGSWAIRDTTAVTALNPALNNTIPNSFSAYMAGGYTLVTDTSNRLTFTGGQLNIHAQTLSAFILDRLAGSIGIIFRQGGVDRSRITSLSNGDVTWGVYNSSGTLLNVPITITNSTGVVTIVAAPIISTATATSLAGFGPLKQLQTITALPSTTTATTQAAADGTNKVSTDLYADRAAGTIIGTPTIVAGAGAGTSPTVSVTSNGHGIQVTVTTGTLPTGTNATVATVTLANALSYTPYPIFSSANGATSLLNGASMIYMTSTGASNVTITSGTTALVAATTYVWNISL